MDLAAEGFWALLATVTMTGIMQAAQGLGFSRMSLPFLLGTWITGRRPVALVIGVVIAFAIGALFAHGYFVAFEIVGGGGWWFGSLLGFAHGLAVLLLFLPVMPYLHPRVATEYDAPTPRRRLAPPGFLGLNYGIGTPAAILIAQTAYGAVLTIGYAVSS